MRDRLAPSSPSSSTMRLARRTASVRAVLTASSSVRARQRAISPTCRLPTGRRASTPRLNARNKAINAFDVRGALSAHVLASGHQDSQSGTYAVVLARVAQLFDVERQHRSGDATGIEWIGLADASIAPGVHPCGLDD